MPLTADMRRSIDQIRDYLFGGGYPDPVGNTEQLCFLFFFYLVQGIDAEAGTRARALGVPFRSLFDGEWELRNPANAQVPNAREGVLPPTILLPTVLHTGQPCIPRSCFRWSWWSDALSGEVLVRFVRDEVFPFFAEIGEASAHDFMRGARLGIDEPTVLTQVIRLVGDLRLDQADADTKGDLFEHVLRQMKQAGELGSTIDQRLLHSLGALDGDLVVVPVAVADQVLGLLVMAASPEQPLPGSHAIANAAGLAFARLMRDASRR